MNSERARQNNFLCMKEKACSAGIIRENTYETRLESVSRMTKIVCRAGSAAHTFSIAYCCAER